MAIKMNGAEFKAWVASDWGENAWWDDYVIVINGEEVQDYDEERIANTDTVLVDGGIVFLDTHGEKSVSATSHFKAWKKTQTHTVVLVEVPNDRLGDLPCVLAQIKARIVK